MSPERKKYHLEEANRILSRTLWLDHTSENLWEALGLTPNENKAVIEAVSGLIASATYPSQVIERLLVNNVLTLPQKLMGLIYVGMILAQGG